MRGRESGVILVNVLVALALGAALVSLMLAGQDRGLDRTRRAAATAQAEALALGAETTVLVALRRDMIEAPEIDHLGEPWALAVAQQDVDLATGRFSVTIRDAQAGFDVNALAAGDPGTLASFTRLLDGLDLPASTAGQVLAALRLHGRLADAGQLSTLDAASRETLAPHLAFFSTRVPVNLNTASAPVVAAVLTDRSAAIRLVALRDRKGFVEEQDLRDLGIIGGASWGLRSDLWDVETRAEADGVEVILTSRLERSRGVGRVEVRVAGRRFGEIAPASLLAVPADL